MKNNKITISITKILFIHLKIGKISLFHNLYCVSFFVVVCLFLEIHMTYAFEIHHLLVN